MVVAAPDLLVSKVVDAKPKLFQVISTIGSAGSFAGLLHRRQEQTHENTNDGDDNE